jgi:hypothetical protein
MQAHFIGGTMSVTISVRAIVASAAALLALGLAAYAVGANAQPAPGERVIGYAVYARSHYVLVQRADGSLRSCEQDRQTLLRQNPTWACINLGAVPPAT